MEQNCQSILNNKQQYTQQSELMNDKSINRKFQNFLMQEPSQKTSSLQKNNQNSYEISSMSFYNSSIMTDKNSLDFQLMRGFSPEQLSKRNSRYGPSKFYENISGNVIPSKNPIKQSNTVDVFNQQQFQTPNQKVKSGFCGDNNIKVHHGIRTDYLQKRDRWDDNQLLQDYFGSIKNAKVHNINQSKTPKLQIRQIQSRMSPQRISISSVLEVNPDQFEDSLRSCSLRLKASKYHELQKYLNKEKWDKIFGKTDMMKRREVRKKFYQERQTLICEKFAILMKDRQQQMIEEFQQQKNNIKRGCLQPKIKVKAV